MRLRGIALVAAAASLWGFWPLILRPSGLPGGVCAAITLMVMSLPAPFVFRKSFLADRKATLAIIALGVFDALNGALYFSALQKGPVVVAVLTHYLAPLLVALSAPLVLKERLSRRALFATPVILLGLGLLIGPPREGIPVTTAILGASSAVFYAALVIASKVAGRTWSPLAVTSCHSPISVVLLLLFFRAEAIPAQLDWRLLLLIGGAAVCGLFATGLFNAGLRKVDAPIASALTYLEPLVATLVGAIAFDERPEPLGYLGAMLVLAGGVFVASEKPAEPA